MNLCLLVYINKVLTVMKRI